MNTKGKFRSENICETFAHKVEDRMPLSRYDVGGRGVKINEYACRVGGLLWWLCACADRWEQQVGARLTSHSVYHNPRGQFHPPHNPRVQHSTFLKVTTLPCSHYLGYSSLLSWECHCNW